MLRYDVGLRTHVAFFTAAGVAAGIAVCIGAAIDSINIGGLVFLGGFTLVELVTARWLRGNARLQLPSQRSALRR